MEKHHAGRPYAGAAAIPRQNVPRDHRLHLEQQPGAGEYPGSDRDQNRVSVVFTHCCQCNPSPPMLFVRPQARQGYPRRAPNKVRT